MKFQEISSISRRHFKFQEIPGVVDTLCVRMDETADARRILTGVHQSDWSRPVGRPYTCWIATLKSDLSLHNLTFEDAIELAMDKSLWRLLVASRATH